MSQGQFHIYTGDGKGKTTAAVGLAVRAAGAGWQVYMGQFIKDMCYSEVPVLRGLPGVVVELYGTGEGCLIEGPPAQRDRDRAKEGLKRLKQAMGSGRYDLVIADEINVAWQLGLISQEEWTAVAQARPPGVELVFTGRGVPPGGEALADLVTHMQQVKHYYATKGLAARPGIES